MKVIVVDLEGVLSNNTHRAQHAVQKDYGMYDVLFPLDPCNAGIKSLAASFRMNGTSLVISTGKKGDRAGREAVKKWLEVHGIQYFMLLMRQPSDDRPSPDVKADHLADIMREGCEVVLAIDDRMKNVAMYKARGIPALLYANGTDY